MSQYHILVRFCVGIEIQGAEVADPSPNLPQKWAKNYNTHGYSNLCTIPTCIYLHFMQFVMFDIFWDTIYAITPRIARSVALIQYF